MHTVSSFWDLLGDVLAAPESALCGWIGVILLYISLSGNVVGNEPKQT